MKGLRDARLTETAIPENDPLTDSNKAWDYFNNLRYDVILANPPFAGEMKDRDLLAHYDLAKAALRRAGDKQPKEERDVLFIERILNMLKPGGRAAIVLPQGKFNNSSLSYIRAWILKKARLLAVVGLHPNTFKPHTGTKTSVLFVQKYTQQEIDNISTVHDTVALACPDYRANIEGILSKYQGADDVPDEAIDEDIADSIAENFGGETEEAAGSNDADDGNEGSDGTESDVESGPDLHDQLMGLKAALVTAETRLAHIAMEIESAIARHESEIENIKKGWTGSKRDLQPRIRELKAEHKTLVSTLKRGAEQKGLKAEIGALNGRIAQTERSISLLTNRGRLQLLLSDEDMLSALRESWIATEVSRRLDYQIFMAVSQHGGKNSSGDYEYVVDKSGSLVEYPEGHAQAGHPVVDQDLVNYELTASDLAEASKIPDEKMCIAESFVRFAQEQRFRFWANI